MTSVGETLRRERLQKKLDLDQISGELKISRRMLDAIEADQYDRLPGGVFAKAFVRQYAGLLGLNGEELAAQVQRSIEPVIPFVQESPKPSVNRLEVSRVEDWNSVGDRGFRLSGSLPAAALVVVVMLICSAVYAWMQRPRTVAVAPPIHAPATVSQPAPQPVAPAPQPATEQTASTTPAATPPAAAPPAATEQGGPPVIVPATSEPPAAQAPVQATAAPPAPSAPGPVHVEIAADELVWMQARVDGKVAFSGTMEANGRRSLDGQSEVMLRLGNAGGVAISLNGKPIGAAGPKGQVRTLQFTSGGFQIVSAKPAPAVSLDPLDR